VSPASPAGVVMKFGGTSVADADAMTRVVNIVRSQRESQAHATPPVVVVSALSKVTDGLIRTAHFADEGDAANASALVSELRDRHIGIASTLTSGARTAQLVEALRAQFGELGDLVAALAATRDVTPGAHDAIVATGELASSRIVAAAFAEQGLPAVWIDARSVLVTDAEHMMALPDMDATCARMRERVVPATARGEIPVLGGFIGATASGVTTTLGRGGSDYSASIFGACIGSGEIPAGGVPGEVHAATYFATDRGRVSLEYLAALVRAKLLYRSRCIEIGFDCDYLRGTAITTRKTVTLHDPRIAGGTALGKVKGAELSVSDSGVAGCRVTIACCAGLGNAVDAVEGDSTYVEDGYVEDGYQWRSNSTIVLPGTTDLGYAPPLYVATDDHLTFPLTRQDIVLVDEFHQGKDVAGAALDAMAAASQSATADNTSSSYTYDQNAMLDANSLPNLLTANLTWQEFQLKPVTGGPFNKIYNVRFSNLAVPMGIDLQSDVTA